MPLQNRVTPLGELIADPARGLVYGNRGCLHDMEGRIRRRFDGKRWIACRLQFRGWKRSPLMQRGRFTELFFLDEATALAAGHRPCFFCRRDDAVRFRAAWEEGNGVRRVLARDIDAVLHRDRLSGGKKRLHPLAVSLAELPDGAMVQEGTESFLIVQGRTLLWSPARYHKAQDATKHPMLLTPPSTLRALSAGYRPVLHTSALELMV
jgi:hypothetical protein